VQHASLTATSANSTFGSHIQHFSGLSWSAKVNSRESQRIQRLSKDYRILVAIDFSLEERLRAQVEHFARALNATVDVLHVSMPDPDFVRYIKARPGESQGAVDGGRPAKARELHRDHDQTLAFGEALRSAGINTDRVLTVQGDVVSSILDHVIKHEIDLLMLGSHHHSAFYRLLHEDVAAEAVHKMPCAVLVVPEARRAIHSSSMPT
jgi:nucleotide-binding universal stress UspA family protein